MNLHHRASHWEGENLVTVWYWTEGAFRVSDFFDTKIEAYRARFLAQREVSK